jgi:hypothetical protein
MTVPYAFANLSGNIALAKLDSNFNTPITIGNTSVLLGNTVSTLTNLTLGNVTITSGNIFTIPVTSGGTGLVSPGSTGNVLTSIGGVWVSNAVVASGGGTGTVTNVSVVTAKGFSGTVANSTSNAAITLSTTFDGIAWSNSTGTLSNVAIGTGLSFSNVTGVLSATGGGGGSPGGSTTQVQFNNAGSFAGDANLTFSGSTLISANLIVSNLTASQAVFSSATKQLVSNPITGTGSVVMNSSPILTSPTLITPDLGTPSAGLVTNLTGTASININGTVGATAAAAGTFTTGTFNTSTVHKGATSGTITIAAPAVAGTQSYTLPTAVPAANGYALTSTTGGVMSWASVAPGGSTTQVQYNNAGAFGGISGFTTDGTRVTASTTIGVGAATPSTSGSGITFPATQSPSTDANTLDDYEEGTWTAGLTCGTSGTITVDPAYSTCRYTKVGRIVTITGFVYISAVSSPTGTLTLTGLPFTNSTGNGYNAGVSLYIYGMSTATNLIGAINNATATMDLRTFSAGTPTTAIAGYFGATQGFILSISYFAS